MSQIAHSAQMVLKLIISRINTFLRFQLSRYVPFFYAEEPEMSRFFIQKIWSPYFIAEHVVPRNTNRWHHDLG
jgi:hypothetical protein